MERITNKPLKEEVRWPCGSVNDAYQINRNILHA
jgi:hypothetical protein